MSDCAEFVGLAQTGCHVTFGLSFFLLMVFVSLLCTVAYCMAQEKLRKWK